MQNLMFYNLDIKELIDRVQIGPQAEVLELLERFNLTYIRNNRDGNITKPLSITKKFYWKPGAYDTIKYIIAGLFEFHKKANSLTKVLERSENTWRIRNIKSKISEIELILAMFRRDGVIMQDNTDDAQEAWNLIKNHVLSQISEILDINVSAYIELCDDDYYLWITYSKTDFTMSYKHHQGSDIQDIFCPGTINIHLKISISKLINALIMNKFIINNMDIRNVTNNRKGYIIGGKWENEYHLEHPYIANTTSNFNSNRGQSEGFRYVCIGNLDHEIDSCVKSLDLISLNVFIKRIIEHYDTRTGPLNSITYTYHGQPNFIDDETEFYEIVGGKISTEHCTYARVLKDMPVEFVTRDSYCAKYCEATSICEAYIENSRVMTKEERERKALELATINAARGRI